MKISNNLFCGVAMLLSSNVMAQSMDHEDVHTIMEQSNPACYITGIIKHVDYKNGHNGYRRLEDIKIEPEYFIWEKECEQFQHNHFTDFEVPKLWTWHLNTTVRVKYIHQNSNWFIHEVFPVFTSTATQR